MIHGGNAPNAQEEGKEMETANYEQDFLNKRGYPRWSQFLRENKAQGKSELTISNEYAQIKLNHLIALGGKANKAKKVK